MKRFVLLLATISSLLIVGFSGHVAAFDCGTLNGSQVSSFTKLLAEYSEIYVRAGLEDQEGAATLYFLPEADTARCTRVASFDLTRDWQKVGFVPVSLTSQPGVLTMMLNDNATVSGASTPQLILASDTPPCSVLDGCAYTFQGEEMALSPRKISTSSDSLRIGLLSDPSIDSVKNVIYSVDGVQKYTKKTLLPFNLNYVSGGEHSVERTVLLSSGQALVDKRIIKHGTTADVNYWLTSLYSRYSKFILFFGGIFLLFLLWHMVYAILRAVYRRRLWRRTHIASEGFKIDQTEVGIQPASKFETSPLEILKKHKKAFGIPLITIAILFIGYVLVLGTFTVDGVSMFPTLKDKSVHPLYTFPANIGKIAGSGYTPTRGAIVVIQKDETTLFDIGVQPKSYVVKRVVGLPEERVVVTNDKITIINKEHPEGFVPDDQYSWLKKKPEIYYNKLDITLKQGELFVVGDNRDESIDSRFYGPVDASQVVGRVIL